MCSPGLLCSVPKQQVYLMQTPDHVRAMFLMQCDKRRRAAKMLVSIQKSATPL